MIDNPYCCVSCINPNIFEAMEINHVNFENIEDPVIYIVGYNEDLECDNCEEGLVPGDLYIDTEYKECFLNSLSRFLGNKLSNNIEYCSNCEGGEIEYRDFVYKNEFGKDHTQAQGMDMFEFLSENGVWDETLMNLVIKELECQHCNYGEYDDEFNFHFDFTEKVYTEDDINSFYGVNIEELNKIGKIYDVEFHKDELDEFVNYLMEYPMLSLKHEVGKKFYEIFEKLFVEGKEILKVSEFHYRGRKRYSDEKVFDNDKLWLPPFGLPSHGRYNFVGKPVLYCTDNIDGIPYELNPVQVEEIDYGRFKVQKNLGVLNITSLFTEKFGEFVSSSNLESTLIKKTYLLTNFLSSCCEVMGFDGIKYKGTSKNVDYYNYALFDMKPEKQLKIDEKKTMRINVLYKKVNY